MSLVRDALATVKRIALLDADVRRIEERLGVLDQRSLDHETRISHIEGVLQFAFRGGPPRLPKR